MTMSKVCLPVKEIKGRGTDGVQQEAPSESQTEHMLRVQTVRLRVPPVLLARCPPAPDTATVSVRALLH